MTCKGLIFDLDGTLLDTLEDLAEAANSTLDYYGFSPHPVDAYRYFVGEGLRTLMQRIVPGGAATEEQLRQYMKKFAEIYNLTWNRKTAPYNGIVEMLSELTAAGLPLAVLSNKPHEFTVLCVETFFLKQHFRYVFGQRDFVAKKPDPAGAVDIAEKMGVAVGDILYVGDTATDMKTGNRAGMKTIGVEWGFRKRAELEEHGAWKIVATPGEVVSYAI